MAEHIKKEEFVRHLAKKMGTDEATAEAWLDATLEAMYQVFKSGKGISLAGFGGFYLDRRRESTAVITSGKAGGLEIVNRSKRLLLISPEPPKVAETVKP